MAKSIIMPKLGFTLESSEIIRWLKHAGDVVEQGDPLLEVTTDKVNMEVESPGNGILDGIRYHEGDVVPVTEVIAYLRSPNEPPMEQAAIAKGAESVKAAEPAPLATAPASVPEKTAPQEMMPHRATPVAVHMAEEKGVDVAAISGTGPGGRVTKQDVQAFLAESAVSGKVRAVPAARHLANELGIALKDVQGTGPRGRVQSADVRAAQLRQKEIAVTPTQTVAAAASMLPNKPEVLKVIPLTGMRATIANRLQKSAQDAPHILFDAEIDVTALEALRARANGMMPEGHARITPTALIAKACAWALKRHPMVNSHLEGQQILLFRDVNIGVAVALEDGLIVPVVHNVESNSIGDIATEIAELTQRARGGKLRMDDLAGGTFSISNLGMFGIDRFTAIINPPETAILAIGRMVKKIVPDENGAPVTRPMMQVTLSVDHRVIDGAVAAVFMRDLREALEHPELLVI